MVIFNGSTLVIRIGAYMECHLRYRFFLPSKSKVLSDPVTGHDITIMQCFVNHESSKGPCSQTILWITQLWTSILGYPTSSNPWVEVETWHFGNQTLKWVSIREEFLNHWDTCLWPCFVTLVFHLHQLHTNYIHFLGLFIYRISGFGICRRCLYL